MGEDVVWSGKADDDGNDDDGEAKAARGSCSMERGCISCASSSCGCWTMISKGNTSDGVREAYSRMIKASEKEVVSVRTADASGGAVACCCKRVLLLVLVVVSRGGPKTLRIMRLGQARFLVLATRSSSTRTAGRWDFILVADRTAGDGCDERK